MMISAKFVFVLPAMIAFYSWQTSTTICPRIWARAFLPSSKMYSTSLGSRINGNQNFASPNHPYRFRSYMSVLPDESTMRVAELKSELESYGISTKAFLEKSELMTAVKKARSEGKTPITAKKVENASTASTSTRSPTTTTEKTTEPTRDKRLAEEVEKIQAMKIQDIKKELQDLGIPTKTFFEKSEFVRALAVARVDGVVNKAEKRQTNGEDYVEYKNVEVLTSDDAGPKKRSQQQQEQQQQQARGNPFGSGPAGVNMGNVADMFKNMGMGGGNPFGGSGATSNPFGASGSGRNPFQGASGFPFGGGDVMNKAQQMMQNPKVREIVMKAQKNPKIMSAVTECMSNPAAFAKYRNDPEVGELIRELQGYL